MEDTKDYGKRITVRIDKLRLVDRRDDILKHFSKFGPIKSYTINTIEFYTNISVNKVLRCGQHILDRSSNDDSPILLLEDDILIEIFERLPTNDMENFAYASELFYRVFQECLDPTHILQGTGSSTIRHPQLYSPFIARNIKDRINAHEHISCLELQGDVQFIFPLLKDLTNITTLKLCGCDLIDANIFDISENLPNIKILHLNRNENLTGRYLASLSTLHELSLAGCMDIRPNTFIEIFNYHENLEKLNLTDCALSTRMLNTIIGNLERLECLAITKATTIANKFFKEKDEDEDDDEYEDEDIPFNIIALLPKLKSLKITNRDIRGEKSSQPKIKRLVDDLKRSETLEFLELRYINTSTFKISDLSQLKILSFYYCYNLPSDLCRLQNLESIEFKYGDIMDESTLNILERCPNLKNVTCNDLTAKLVFKIIDLLDKVNRRRENPIVFKINNVYPSVLKDPRFQDAVARNILR